MELRMLGPLDVAGDDGATRTVGGPKERAVLAVLACHAGKPVSEARLVDALWGEAPPRTANKTLQAYVSRIRKALGDGAIETVPGGYRLALATDAARVERLVARARLAASAGDFASAAGYLDDAQEAWRGRSLGEFGDEPFALAEAARLEELRSVVAEEKVAADLACGRHAELVGPLEALCSQHPYRERLWGQRMLALYRSGRQAEALAVYATLRATLAEELGIDPSPDLRALEEAILRQDVSLDLTAKTSTLPTGVVTFLMTDIESSTDLWDRHHDAMAAALERHDEIIASAVDAANGRLLRTKGEGDSTFSVFTRASDAASAAAAAQRALSTEPWPAPIAIRVRMALHTGEAHERNGDYYGPTPNRAARLRAITSPGRVYVTEATASLIRDHLPHDTSLVEVGHHDLRGLSRAEHVWELRSHDVAPSAAPTTASRPPFPRALSSEDFFVGREDALAELRERWERLSGCEVVFVGGEPGVGKTRLAAHFASTVHAEGSAVLFGRCDEDVGSPYQPFAEALRALVGSLPVEDLRAHGGRRLGEIARIVPTITDYVPGLEAPTPSSPESERFLLFDAVTTLLSSLSRSTPVLLVLDDVHWAGKPTLLLLRHLLRADVEQRVLVIATYRSTEVGGGALGDTLADVPRDESMRRLVLRGLDEAGVARYVAAAAGHELDERGLEFARALHVETEGNPFFIGEVLNHLEESGALYQKDGRWTSSVTNIADLGLPEGVRDVISRRLQRLDDATTRALTVAAVVGSSFDTALVGDVLGLGRDDVVARFEEAVAAGLARETGAGRYEFSHELTRQTLLTGITQARAMMLHREIAEAMEALPGGEERVAELAFHFAEGAPYAPVDKAVDYGLAAARNALDRLAHEEAASVLERARTVLELSAPVDEARRAEVLLALADAMWRGAEGDSPWAYALAAGASARACGRADLLARAAITYFSGVASGRLEPEGAAMCEDALANLSAEHAALRSRVLAALAHYRVFGEALGSRAAELAEEAVRAARASGDSVAIGHALLVRAYSLWGTERIPDAVPLLDEAVERAGATGDLLRVVRAYTARARVRLELGDRAGFDEDYARTREYWKRGVRDPGLTTTHTGRTLSLLMSGRLDEAEADLVSRPIDTTDPTALDIYAGQMFVLRLEQGRTDDELMLARAAVLRRPDFVATHAYLAVALADHGDADEAHAELDTVAAGDFGGLIRDVTFTTAMASAAQTCAVLGAREHADTIAGLLRPHAGRLVVVPTADVCVGAVDRYLGMVEGVAGRFEAAEAYFGSALALEEHIGAPPYAARTKVWYARMLAARDAPGDAARARAVAADALAVAERIGMGGVARDARKLLRPPVPPALRPSGVFVGRERDLDVVRGAWQAAKDGGVRAVVVAGEPGIGKTRLAAEAAREAYADDGVVLFGSCDEGTGAAYRPFVEALERYGLDDELIERLGRHAGALARIVPALGRGRRLPEIADPDTERMLLFEAVERALALVAAEQPVMLVLDDVHWAAAPTLRMLRHLLRSTERLPLLVLGTYRDTELGRDHPLTAVLGDLRRERNVGRITLHGLGEGAVRDLVAAALGPDVDAQSVAHALRDQTQGNPFFVSEVLRHLVESGARSVTGARLPQGVKDVVVRRLSRLSAPTRDVLEIAAVVGPAFGYRLLETIPGAGAVVDAMDEAVRAGVLTEVGAGEVAFSHALIREALYTSLDTERRTRLHGLVAEALAASGSGDSATIAYHFAEAAPGGLFDKAADFANAAADEALDRLAFEDAIDIVDRALAALSSAPAPDLERRAQLYLTRALACFIGSTDDERRSAAARAAKDALAAGAGRIVVEAAYLYSAGALATPVPGALELFDDALAAVGDDPVLRAYVLAHLARYRCRELGEGEAALPYCRKAVRAARAAGHDEALMLALNATLEALFGTPVVDERGRLIDEARVVAERLRIAPPTDGLPVSRAARGLSLADFARWEEIDLGLVAGDRARAMDVLEELRATMIPPTTTLQDARVALLDGRFDDAGEAADAYAAAPGRTVARAATSGAQRLWLAWELGSAQDAITLIEAFADSFPGLVAARAALAMVRAAAGDIDRAAADVDGLCADDLAAVPRDSAYPAALGFLAEACARSSHAASAAVYERLRSFAGLTLLIPNLVAVIGAADRYLGMLATVLGDFDAAHRHFEDAIALESSLASPPLLARTRYWFARMLLVRAAPGDRERARELLRESSASAEALGMTALARDARELLRPPLPGGLAYTGVFVGRDDAFAELRTAWNAVKSGGLRTVLIAGEPGIGKTRLGAEIARAAHREGATVLYGRCDEGLAAAYQPFAEALRAYAAAEPDLAAELGPRAAALARILPDLETGDAASPRPTDPESERLLLFEAVERALAIAARTNPAVLVLDDLHWAAQPTLLLLRHLLRAATDVPLLVVGTYRDTELDRRHPLGAVLADLRRETGVHRVKLGGLDEAAIADLLQAAGSDEERGGLAHAVYERTDGNPFFVGEVLRELVETGWTSDLGLPEGVKEIIGRRLDKVSAAANTALEVASVAGAEFSLALLESVPEAGAADGLLDALDEAVRAGLLTETPSGYAFGHALVRQTLYESLSSARRMRLHRHVGEALEATGADASVLAYHFAEAALDGQIEKAADYANAAATEAIERLAFEDALDLTARAIAVLGLAPDVDHARRGRLVATKATALFAVGELEEPQRLAVRAAQDARTAGSVELLVEAAILSTATLLGTPVPGALDLLEEALDALPSDDVKYRPRLLARIAHYRAWALSEGEAARPYFEEAIRSARDSEQTDVLFLAIEAASRALEGTPLIEERRALADEAIAIADRMWPDGGPMLLGIGTAYLPAAMRSDRIDLCMIVGDRAGATDALDEMKAVVDRFASSGRRYMPEPRTRRFVSGSLYLQDTQAAFLDGSFDQARELIDLRAEESSDAGLVVTGAQRIWLDWEVGNVERQIPLIEAFLEQLPGIVSARALLAGFHAVLGDVSRATEIARELHAEDLAVIPRDAAYPAALAFLAETSARVGDESAAATLARHLRPWAGLALLIPNMVAVIGAADRFRGMLATVMRRFAEAQRHFEDAIEFETRLESPPLLARTRYWYARMLLQRADPASRARADGLLDEALKAANELGMAGLVAEIGDLTR